MVQGGLRSKAKAKPKALKAASSHKHTLHPNAVAGKSRKGQPTAKPSNAAARAEHASNMTITKIINKRNETMAAARALQGGGKLKVTDLKSRGKETVKDMRRALLKKKSSKLQMTLNKLKEDEHR